MDKQMYLDVKELSKFNETLSISLDNINTAVCLKQKYPLTGQRVKRNAISCVVNK